MIKLIKKTIHTLRKTKRTIIWNIENNELQKNNKKNNYKIEKLIIDGCSVLIVIPHPDDELIGCFSIISNPNVHADLYYTGLTGYDTSKSNRHTRMKELETISECFSRCLFVDEPDSHSELIRLLNEKKYDYVVLPAYIDWHWEHRKTCLSVLELLCSLKMENNPKILFYMVTVPIPDEYVNRYGEVRNEKWELFKSIYLSQKHMPIERFKVVEKSYLKNNRIEPFFQLNFANIGLYLNSIKKVDEKELDNLEPKINNLVVIRKEALRIYNSIKFY